MVSSSALSRTGVVALRSWRHLLALAAVVLFGAVLRLGHNDVTVFSGADENAYLRYATAISADWTSYPRIVSAYIDDESKWVYPPPSRWAGVAVTGAACWAVGCTMRTLATVEAFAGIAAILLTYLFASALFGRLAAWLAAAFTAVSPIQLGMGRRALEDELFLVVLISVLWITLVIARTERPTARQVAAAIAINTIAFGIKEVFLFFYPALIAFALIVRGTVRPRRTDLVLLAMPPVIYAVILTVLSADLGALFAFARIYLVERSADVLYVLQFQSGPAHEPFLDLYLLAPLVAVIALVAIGRATATGTDRREVLAVGGFALLSLLVFAFVLKDARYYMPDDAALRVLASWGVVSLAMSRPALAPLVAGVAAAVNAVVELPLFDAVFLRADVYDPVLANLLRALDAIPR